MGIGSCCKGAGCGVNIYDYRGGDDSIGYYYGIMNYWGVGVCNIGTCIIGYD